MERSWSGVTVGDWAGACYIGEPEEPVSIIGGRDHEEDCGGGFVAVNIPPHPVPEAPPHGQGLFTRDFHHCATLVGFDLAISVLRADGVDIAPGVGMKESWHRHGVPAFSANRPPWGAACDGSGGRGAEVKRLTGEGDVAPVDRRQADAASNNGLCWQVSVRVAVGIT
jgi:hypothetical protein